MEWFVNSGNEKFAARLSDSQIFATFFDSYYEKSITNMLLYLNKNRDGMNLDLNPEIMAEYDKRIDELLRK